MAVLLNMTDYADGFLIAPALPHLSHRLNLYDSEVLKNCSFGTGLGAIHALILTIRKNLIGKGEKQCQR